MKKLLFILTATLFHIGAMAQSSYTLNYTPNAGNPGGLNTDPDETTVGWTPLIAGSISANQWSPSITLPFAFNYFGNPVTSFRASANGLVTFSNTTTLPNDNVALPSASLTDSTIACFWDAFTTSPPTSSNDQVVWRVWGTAPNRQLWIKWVSFEIGAPKVVDATFMCVLEETSDKIYLVEGAFTVVTSPLPTTLASTTTAGIQLNNTTGLMYGTPYRPRPANAVALTDNNVLAFTPYIKTNMSFVTATSLQPNLSNISRNAQDEAIMRIDVDMAGELSPLNLTQIAFNTSGTTLNSDIVNARVFYGGNDSNFSTANQFGSTISSPNGIFNVNGTQALKMGRNYFWVTYSISNSAAINSLVDISCAAITVDGLTQPLLETAPVGSRTIKIGLSGTVPVGTGNTYEYLSDVFKEINANGLSGNTTLSITSDINDTAVALLTYSGNYAIRIVPSAEVFRNFTVRFPSTYIELSGAQHVTFDGKGPTSGTGRYLRFINRDTTGSTFNLINGARFDTIRSCIIEGGLNSQTKGVINLGTSVSSATGVRDIFIINNDIRDRSDSTSIPAIMIYSAGTTGLTNGNITISQNNIFNYRRSAVYVNTGNVNHGNFTISNNHMYYNNAVTAPTTFDLISLMFIPGTYSDNNVISGNYIGGQSPFCAGSPWLATNNVNWVGMNINAGFIGGTSISGNTIQNLTVTNSILNSSFVGIRMEYGVVNVNNNLIGHPTTPNSITNSAMLTYGIYSLYGTGVFTINNNTVANIKSVSVSTQSSTRGICIQAGGAIPTITNNTVFNLSSDGLGNTGLQTPTTNILHGIGVVSSPEVAPTTIRNNKVYNLAITNTSINLHPAGIVIDQSTSNGIVEGNTIYGIENPSAGTIASIHGMFITGGTKNWIVRNNMIALTNGTNTNDITIRGISDNNASSTNKYYNNTIYIGGTVAGGDTNTFAFERRANGAITLRNNIFYNERTGGTGIHAAIGNVTAAPATNWNSSTSGYNLLIASNPAQIGAWKNTFNALTFAQWQDSTTGDKTSWSDVSALVPSSSFFKDAATGNLAIDSSNVLCWYVNGKGIALAGQTQDIHGQNRSVTIATGPVDIGADEFPTTTLPPNAVVTGNILTGDSSVFTVAGRTIAKVYWNMGSFPSSLNMRYYTGTNPPAAGAEKYFTSYYHFAPVGAGNFDADVQLFYDSALFGNVDASANLVMAKYVGSWSHNPLTIVNAANTSFRVNNLNALNIFTGTDISNPLPVKLVQFNGAVLSNDAHLFWQSASEINASTYEIERSTDARKFDVIGTVAASGKASKYTYADIGVFEKQQQVYYRLKMTDHDGSSVYSNIIELEHKQTETLNASVYPNPYTPESNLTFTSNREQTVSVTICDIRGQLISTQEVSVTAGINAIPVSMQSLQNGVYFITLKTAGNSTTIKMIK